MRSCLQIRTNKRKGLFLLRRRFDGRTRSDRIESPASRAVADKDSAKVAIDHRLQLATVDHETILIHPCEQCSAASTPDISWWGLHVRLPSKLASEQPRAQF